MKTKIGLCITGSFCTLQATLVMAQKLVDNDYIVYPVLSNNVATMDTRFYKCQDFRDDIERICKNKCICTIQQAEPIGPKNLFDICLVAPATGNTLSKIKHAITDTPVTMAVKAHLRNNKPVVIAVSTNDGLSASAQNIGELLNRKNIYFVPFCQDDAEKKYASLVADLRLVIPTIEQAKLGKQIQPILTKIPENTQL